MAHERPAWLCWVDHIGFGLGEGGLAENGKEPVTRLKSRGVYKKGEKAGWAVGKKVVLCNNVDELRGLRDGELTGDRNAGAEQS